MLSELGNLSFIGERDNLRKVKEPRKGNCNIWKKAIMHTNKFMGKIHQYGWLRNCKKWLRIIKN